MASVLLVAFCLWVAKELDLVGALKKWIHGEGKEAKKAE